MPCHMAVNSQDNSGFLLPDSVVYKQTAMLVTIDRRDTCEFLSFSCIRKKFSLLFQNVILLMYWGGLNWVRIDLVATVFPDHIT